MDGARPSTLMRVATALALSAVCALLVTLLLSGPPGAQPFGMRQTIALVESLCLITMGLAIYAWAVYPPAGSLLISAVVLICLLWAWALRKASGLDLAAFGLLVGAAVWQQRRRPRQFLHMQQAIGDLNEERTVKDQAIAAASQTREALQKKHSRYAQLQTIAEALSQMADLAAIARLVVESAFRLIGKSDVCLLFLVDQERQELSLYASEKRESIKAIRAKHGDQFDRYVLRTHAPLLVNDVRRDFRFTVTVSPERDVSSVIACPLLLGQ
ncbi:MAG: hypothetical protein HYY58_05735, partial [Candidatus Omnitrophica bacterium]|nr:hypothetical protein [Candidatus Omnitrophota bacterium]